MTSVTPRGQATLIMSVLEFFSLHMGVEEYIGKRPDPKWSSNEKVLAAFEEFGRNIEKAEEKMVARNEEAKEPLKLGHRAGPALLPYTLLHPSSGDGLTGRGVPNSISM